MHKQLIRMFPWTSNVFPMNKCRTSNCVHMMCIECTFLLPALPSRDGFYKYEGRRQFYASVHALLLHRNLVERLVSGVQARTQTIKYVRGDPYISTTSILSKSLYIVKLSILMQYFTKYIWTRSFQRGHHNESCVIVTIMGFKGLNTWTFCKI